MNGATYTASIEFAADPATIGCSCDNCDWAGAADKLGPIGDAILTPGHPSPAGRCPDCDSLAYVVKPAPTDSLYARTSDLEFVNKAGGGTIYVVNGEKPFSDGIAINRCLK